MGIPVGEGIALFDNAEIAMLGSAGIGIGTTSGKRDEEVDLYVGYRRDDLGNFAGAGVVFEGGIGTKVGPQDTNVLEVYKDTKFFSNHTGIGGTGELVLNRAILTTQGTFDQVQMVVPSFLEEMIQLLLMQDLVVSGSIHSPTNFRSRQPANDVAISTVKNETHDISSPSRSWIPWWYCRQ